MGKKILSRMAILILVVGLIFTSGCKSGTSTDISKDDEKSDIEGKEQDEKAADEDDGDKPSADEEEGYTLPIVEEPITLVFLKRDSEDPGASFKNDNALIWDEYEKKTGIKMKFDAVPSSELRETVQLRLAAKQDIPDLVEIPGDQDGAYITRYYSDGVIIALNEYIDKYAPNIKATFEKYPEYKKAVTLPDGNITSFGSIRSSTYQFRSQAIRCDWLEKLNLEIPETPDELLDAAKMFIAEELGGTKTIGMSGYGNQWKELGHAWGLHYVTGDGWTEDNGKVIYEPVTEEYQDFLRFLNKCVKEGVFPADWVSVDKKTHLARVMNGQVGIQVRVQALETLGYLDPNDSMNENNPDADWRLIPPLDGPYGKGIIVKEPVAQRWRTISVTSANKYPAETVKWLDYTIFSEEGQRYNMYGLEGITYKIEDGKVVKIPSDLDDNKPLEDGSWLGYNYLPAFDTSESDEMFISDLDIPSDHPALLAVTDSMQYVEEPFVPPIPGIEEGKRLSTLLADISTYVEEMFYKFVLGETSIDNDFQKYIDKLNSIGLNEVIEIYQQSYDSLSE